MSKSDQEPVDALLLISTHCPHCATVLKGATELLKEGGIGHLQIYNLDLHPEIAQEHGVRSVPWIRIGPFELSGTQSKTELEGWVQRVADPKGMPAYFAELMAEWGVQKVVSMVRKTPSLFSALMTLLGDPETELGVRVGIGVVVEEFQGTETLKSQLTSLVELTQHEDSRVRGDACYYLGFTGEQEVTTVLTTCLEDENVDVRESAADALEMLRGDESL